MRQVVNEERRGFISKLSVILRGERPSTSCNTEHGDKRTGETNRVLPVSHKSAEPVKAEWWGTSALVTDSASESAKERENRTDGRSPGRRWTPPTRKWAGRPQGRWSAKPLWKMAVGDGRETERQPASETVGLGGRIPHEVESAPTADKRPRTEPENLAVAPTHPGIRRARMIEATDERGGRGRSLHSSPRTGKPSTWRREAVDTACRQGVAQWPTR